MGKSKKQTRTLWTKKTVGLTLLSVGILGLAVGGIIEHKDKQATVVKAEKKTTAKPKTKALTDDEVFLANVSLDDWRLPLVGPDHLIKAEVNEATDLAAVGNYLIDKRILPDYEALAQACQDAQFPLVIISAYRSVDYQQQVLNAGVQQRVANGMTEEEALADAKKTMTEPGHSEHHTGLALDVVDESWYTSYPSEVLHSDFGYTEGGKWLAKQAPEYGFIIRYPEGKEAITKIDYEPWHLRYVGKEYAQYITTHQLTLEEFLQNVQSAKDKQQKIE